MLSITQIRVILIIGLVQLMMACTAVPSLRDSNQAVVSSEFSHEKFDQVLQRHVDHQGRVDYTALKEQADDLEDYYYLVTQYSPDSNPELFADKNARLAYWINAYNAAAIKIVLEYYPISGVGDVTRPYALFFVPGKWRFFVFHRPRFGNVATNLYYLENSVIRKRYNEPRIHFAVNCASIGCPYLPRDAFTGPLLDQQLEKEARKFFSQQRNFRINRQTKTVFLSSILDWYEDDFIEWLKIRYPKKQEHSLLDYVAHYVDVDTVKKLRGSASGYRIQFISYDWGLNDSKAQL